MNLKVCRLKKGEWGGMYIFGGRLMIFRVEKSQSQFFRWMFSRKDVEWKMRLCEEAKQCSVILRFSLLLALLCTMQLLAVAMSERCILYCVSCSRENTASPTSNGGIKYKYKMWMYSVFALVAERIILLCAALGHT